MSRALHRRVMRLEGSRGRVTWKEIEELITRCLVDPEFSRAWMEANPGRPRSKEAELDAEIWALGFEPLI